MGAKLPRGHVSVLRSFLSFGGLSGVGWMLDFSLLILLVGVGDWPDFAANLLSSLVAAAMVFLVSRRLVFASTAGRVPTRLAAYLLYTILIVLIASAALQLITDAFEAELLLNATAAAALTKVLITPPQLILNFFMSRFLNERRLG